MICHLTSSRVGPLFASVSLLALATSAAHAQWPRSEGGMNHILIDFDGTNVSAELDTETIPSPLPLRAFDETYEPPADVLNGKAYNDQYGWLADGIFSPPAGTAFWVETLDATPGLEVYEGGMRPMRDMHTYAPILGTDGSSLRWKWSGAMTHNWYAASEFGDYSARYVVYIGDEITGEPVDGYGSDVVSLNWIHTEDPTPFVVEAPVPGVAGTDNSITVRTGRTDVEGRTVLVAVGLGLGATGVPGCPGVVVEIADARRLGATTLDSAGIGTLDVFVVPAAAGRTVYVQAVDRIECTTSNVLCHTF